MAKLTPEQKNELNVERESMLAKLERGARTPLTVLGFVWLILLIIQLTTSGPQRELQHITTAIWIIFLVDFIIRFIVAPKKKEFLKHNWLTTLALLVPALRVFQFAGAIRAFAATGGISIVQIVGSINRGITALSRTMGRRGAEYVLMITAIVALVSAAAILRFEQSVPNGPKNYGQALYWSIMMITTIGSDFWPQTTAGKVLTVLLSLYSVAILSYVAATLASFFVDRDAENPDAAIASDKSIAKLHAEVIELREDIKRMMGQKVDSPAPLSPGKAA